MEKLVRPTRGTRFIGLSNFSPSQVDEIVKIAKIKPKVHQFEVHPYLQQSGFISQSHARNITTVAYSPLANTNPAYSAGGGSKQPKILLHSVIAEIARTKGCTAAQVVLAWNMKRGVVVIPKAAKKEHRRENIEAEEKCRLESGDMEKIGKLDAKLRLSTGICDRGNLKSECFKGLDASPAGT
jgi:alcohol dehydrogenase (NADP+)